jgi:hypothetical protein
MRRKLIGLGLVGGVIAVVVVAGVDALRSSDNHAASLPTRSSTTTSDGSGGASPPRCIRGRQVEIAIEMRLGVATVVLRHVGMRPCFQPAGRSRFLVFDRRGKRIAIWDDLPFGGIFRRGTEQTFALPDVYTCNRQGPFTAVAQFRAYSVRREGLSRSEITC